MIQGTLKGSTFRFVQAILAGQFETAIQILHTADDLDINVHFDHHRNESFKGITPLHMACYFGAGALVSALLNRKNILTEERDLNGKTAMHYAIVGTKSTQNTERLNIIHQLAFFNQNLLTIADQYGNMPAHLAALQKRTQNLMFLFRLFEDQKYVVNQKTMETPIQIHLKQINDELQSKDKIDIDTVPSLTFLCLRKIAQTQELRTEAFEVLPEILQEAVERNVSQTTKLLEKMTFK